MAIFPPTINVRELDDSSNHHHPSFLWWNFYPYVSQFNILVKCTANLGEYLGWQSLVEKFICPAISPHVLSRPWITQTRDIPFESHLVFASGYKISVLMSHLECETGPRFTDIWCLEMLGLSMRDWRTKNIPLLCRKVFQPVARAPVWRNVLMPDVG